MKKFWKWLLKQLCIAMIVYSLIFTGRKVPENLTKEAE